MPSPFGCLVGRWVGQSREPARHKPRSQSLHQHTTSYAYHQIDVNPLLLLLRLLWRLLLALLLLLPLLPTGRRQLLVGREDLVADRGDIVPA